MILVKHFVTCHLSSPSINHYEILISGPILYSSIYLFNKVKHSKYKNQMAPIVHLFRMNTSLLWTTWRSFSTPMTWSAKFSISDNWWNYHRGSSRLLGLTWENRPSKVTHRNVMEKNGCLTVSHRFRERRLNMKHIRWSITTFSATVTSFILLYDCE
jgi:hypothetical protein